MLFKHTLVVLDDAMQQATLVDVVPDVLPPESPVDVAILNLGDEDMPCRQQESAVSLSAGGQFHSAWAGSVPGILGYLTVPVEDGLCRVQQNRSSCRRKASAWGGRY